MRVISIFLSNIQQEKLKENILHIHLHTATTSLNARLMSLLRIRENFDRRDGDASLYTNYNPIRQPSNAVTIKVLTPVIAAGI